MNAAAQDAANHCASLVRASDFERYAAALFATHDQRRSLLALFAFNIEIARVREQISQSLAGEIRLQWWSDLLAGRSHGAAAANPVAAELVSAIERHALPLELLKGMIDAHRFDLYDEPMQTMAELDAYLAATAAALFALGARVAGSQDGIDELVRHAGLAFGLARIIEAVPAHASRGRIYLPLEELDRAGVAAADVLAGASPPALRECLHGLAARAQEHLTMAFERLPSREPAAQAFLPLALVERKLRRMMSASYKPFAPAAASSNLATLWALWRASRSRPFSA